MSVVSFIEDGTSKGVAGGKRWGRGRKGRRGRAHLQERFSNSDGNNQLRHRLLTQFISSILPNQPYPVRHLPSPNRLQSLTEIIEEEDDELRFVQPRKDRAKERAVEREGVRMVGVEREKMSEDGGSA